MEIEKHINNLEKYCEDDDLFEKDGDFKEFCDNHIADIKAVINELRNTQSDLYEANHRIADLLLTLGDRDRIIDLMARVIDNYDSQLGIFEYEDKDDVIESFKDFDKRINTRKKKGNEFKDADNKS